MGPCVILQRNDLVEQDQSVLPVDTFLILLLEKVPNKMLQ